MSIKLIVRGKEFGIFIDVEKFPVFCPSCHNYVSEIYEHPPSRYGDLGWCLCDCGEKLKVNGADSWIEYANIQVRKLKVSMDFKKLFKLKASDFEKLKINYGYDIIEEHTAQTIKLNDLITLIEKRTGKKIVPMETRFPSTLEQQKWLRLMD